MAVLDSSPRSRAIRVVLSKRTVAVGVVSCVVAAALAACGSSSASSASSAAPTNAGGSAVAASTKTMRVGVFELASATVIDQTVAAFEGELKTKLAPQKVSFDLKNAEGDQSLISSISKTFAESSDDGIAVIGTPAVIALAQQIKNKPIFALAMGDPVGAKLATSLDAPGGNVTGSVDYVDPAILLKSIMAISPAPKKIGTIYDPSNENMQVWIKALRAAIKSYPGVSIVESTISGAADVPTASRSLNGRVDAELIGPDATVFAGLAAVGATANTAKIPVYVCGGDSTITGILASIGPNYPTLGRLGADAAAKVFGGTPAAQVAFGQPTGVELTVNKATLTKLKITLPAALAATATVQ
jgi:putative ABC transport system substrate-binding protein